MDTKSKNDKNLSNKGNSKGFNKGKEPDIFGPGDGRETGGRSTAATYQNEVGAVPDANGDKNKIYEKRMITPREPVLNAVSWPNNTKMNKKDYSVLKYHGDEMGKEAPANNTIGGIPKPNNIR